MADRKVASPADNTGVTDLAAAVAAALDPSRVKAFLYKQEPNMAKIKDPPLQLISATTGFFLKSLVDASMRISDKKRQPTKYNPEPAVVKRSSKRRRGNSTSNDAGSQTTYSNVMPCDPPLISLNMVQQAVRRNPTFKFLKNSLEKVPNETGDSLRPMISVSKTARRPAPAQNSGSAKIDDSNSGDAANSGTKASVRGPTKSKRKRPSSSITAQLKLDGSKAPTSNISGTRIPAVLATEPVESNNRKPVGDSIEINVDEGDYD